MAEYFDGNKKISRRTALGLGSAAIAAIALGDLSSFVRPAAAQASGSLKPVIKVREAWAQGRNPVSSIQTEQDVKFLLVHHTASTNDYSATQVAKQIQGFYSYHTGPEKGWPDVAYNFFIDKFGGIWEGRAGSLAGPVRGDATGGSQGFAVLTSLIGDHSKVPVSAAAQQSLIKLLAWQADIYNVDTQPGSTISFVSRGSNRWAKGETVTAKTISGHRDMSATTCPGDYAYNVIQNTLPIAVSNLLQKPVNTTSTSTTIKNPETSKVTEESTTTKPNSDDIESTLEQPENGVASTAIVEAQSGISATVKDESVGNGNATKLLIAGVAATGAVTAASVVALQRKKDKEAKQEWIEARHLSDDEL